MNKLKIFAISFLFALSCGCTTVPPGYVGIKVNQWGSNRGVQDYPIVTGRVNYNPVTEDIIVYPAFAQPVSWSKSNNGNAPNEEVSFNSKLGLQFTSDISLTYQLDRSRAPYFYDKFRQENMDIFTHGYMRNVARDVVNEISAKYTDDEIMGAGKEAILAAVKIELNKRLKDIGISIDQIGFTSAIRPPQSLVDAIEAKQKSIQKAIQKENELRETQAEAAKIVAAAEGTRKANEIVAKSIDANPSILKWREMDIQKSAIDKWDGAMPQYQGSGNLPFILMKGKGNE